jgi:hypothetical protein
VDAQGQTTTPLDAPVSLAAGEVYPVEFDETWLPPVREKAPAEYDIDTLRNLIHN